MPAARPCRDPRCALGGSTPTERSPIAGHRPRSASAAIFVPRWARANRADVDRARVAALDASSIERPRRHFGSPRANPSHPPHLSLSLSLARARSDRADSRRARVLEPRRHRRDPAPSRPSASHDRARRLRPPLGPPRRSINRALSIPLHVPPPLPLYFLQIRSRRPIAPMSIEIESPPWTPPLSKNK